MKFHVNGGCIGCGLCVSSCPEVFRMTDGNVAEADGDARGAVLEAAVKAKEDCPVSAIETEKEED